MFAMILYRNFEIHTSILLCYTKFDFKKFENEPTIDDLPRLGQLFLVTSENKKMIAQNVTECPTAS